MLRTTVFLLLIVAVVWSAVPPTASADDKRWDLFLMGGYASGKLDDRDNIVEDDQTVDGLTTGVGFQLRVYDEFAIELDLRYTQKGGKGTVDTLFSEPLYGVGKISNAEIALNYLEIPILFIYALDTGVNSYLRAYGGPSFNVLVSADINGTVEGQAFQDDSTSPYQSMEYCFLVGAGFNYDFGPFQGLIDGRWVAGLSGVTQSNDADFRVKTETWEVTVGVGFRLAGEGY